MKPESIALLREKAETLNRYKEEGYCKKATEHDLVALAHSLGDLFEQIADIEEDN